MPARLRAVSEPTMETNNLAGVIRVAPQPTTNDGPPKSRSLYLLFLTWTFTAFNSIRILGYLPTVLAIIESSNSSQHSMLTWITWLGANSTMAAWLYENNGRRMSKAVAVNVGNTTMCLVTTLVIVYYRI